MNLIEHLRQVTHAAPSLCVAYSGGPDSSALLHALAHTPDVRARGLRALHVDHGLHADSAAWAEHCAAFCKALGVPLTCARVTVVDERGEGLEAAARRARRVVFAEHLRDGEWLALAHHRDDQIETILLKLLRGAGPEGLAGMRVLRPFARGHLWRPLLEVPRTALRDYVASNGLACIDDPANGDPRFSRNVLRSDILPRINAHWPHAGAAILHSARLCRDTADYLDHDIDTALARLRRAAGTLDAAGWAALPDALRAPVLHRWLRERGLSAPGDAPGRELHRQVARSAEDALPCVAWHGAEVRIWDGRLHAGAPLAPLPETWQAEWNGSRLDLPVGCGTLDSASPAIDSDGADAPLRVRLRAGGERIQPAGDAHTRELRDLFQQARVPPWLRGRCPLIYAGDDLLAVADVWVSERGRAAFAARGLQPRWQRPAGWPSAA